MSDPTLELHARNLAPAQYDRAEASVRRRTVEAALQSSHLRVSEMFESGSWTHGTSIKAKSDVVASQERCKGLGAQAPWDVTRQR